MGVIARVKQALNASSRMWKTFSLLFLAATIGWSHKAGDLMLVDEAVKLLQIDNVQSLEKNLLNVKAEKAEKEQEVEALKAELELAKNNHAAQMAEMKSSHAEELEKLRSTLQGKVDKSWTLVDFMMKVLKKTQGAAKAREDLMDTQATMVGQLKAEVGECKENIRDNLKMVRDSQAVIQVQKKTIEDLKSVVSKESSLNAAYQQMRDADCDYLAPIITTISTQREEIENLKKALFGEQTVTNLLNEINNAANSGAAIVTTQQHDNWGILEECQDVLKKQSSSLDLLRTLASERVTRDDSLRFKQDDEGHIVAADFCQCIPDPTELTSPMAISLSKVNDEWSPMWTAWEYKNCERTVMQDGTIVDFGSGSKIRRRLKCLDAEVWEEGVEEVSCTLPSQCQNYKDLNSPSRKSTAASNSDKWTCDKVGWSHILADWRGSGWYRVTGGARTRLADTQVPQGHCGTYCTGSLTGGHPTVAQGEVTRTVNFHCNGGTYDTNTVRVLSCGAYYVYHLENTPNCQLGYCTV